MTRQDRIDALVGDHAARLSARLQAYRNQLFPPEFPQGAAQVHLGRGGGAPRRQGRLPAQAPPRRSRPLPRDPPRRTPPLLRRRRPGAACRPRGPRQGDRHATCPAAAPATTSRSIAVINFKGGSGKTTTAAHLAQRPRSTATGCSPSTSTPRPRSRRSTATSPSSTCSTAAPSTTPSATRTPCPSRRSSSRATSPTSTSCRATSTSWSSSTRPRGRSPTAPAAGRLFFTRVGDCLAEVEGRYDLVVIDCPPQLGFLTISALSRGDRGAGDRPSADARRHVDVPVPADDLEPPRRRRGGRGRHELRLAALPRHPLRARRRPAEPDGRLHARAVRRPRPEPRRC